MTSSSKISVESQKAFIVANRLEWTRTTPFGMPVEPLVYIMIAMSFGCGGLFAVIQTTTITSYFLHIVGQLLFKEDYNTRTTCELH